MITAEKARKMVIAGVKNLSAERIPLRAAIGRVLAQDIFAVWNSPRFDNSAMDGYAVKSANLAGASPKHGITLKAAKTIRAGTAKKVKIGSGKAALIMTGGRIPEGADAVVMKEMTRKGRNGEVLFFHSPEPGEYIRRRGGDMRRGDKFLSRGSVVTPYTVSALASQGMNKIMTIRRPAAAVLSTGDEIFAPGVKLPPGGLWDSNGPAVSSALRLAGADVRICRILPDNPGKLKKAFAGAFQNADMVLISGGVSVGDFDYTKKLLKELGVKTVFWRVAIKPGKPLFFGLWKGKPVFGLPGNPLSSLVCVEEFVKPAIREMSGLKPARQEFLKGRAENEYIKEKGRQQYLFCRAIETKNGFSLKIIKSQGSSMLKTAVGANAIAVAPAGLKRIHPGMKLDFKRIV
ncbi:MAG: gephyrin-like molybdotransferase Glp [bacterium]